MSVSTTCLCYGKFLLNSFTVDLFCLVCQFSDCVACVIDKEPHANSILATFGLCVVTSFSPGPLVNSYFMVVGVSKKVLLFLATTQKSLLKKNKNKHHNRFQQIITLTCSTRG